MNEGWVKVHRQMLSWEWFDNSKMVHLFLYLLLSATTKPIRYKGILLKRGQLATNRRKLGFVLNLSEKGVRTGLKRLVDGGVIRLDNRHAKGRHIVVITICNYDIYQANQEREGPSKVRQKTLESPTGDDTMSAQATEKGLPLIEQEEKNIIEDKSSIPPPPAAVVSRGEEFARLFNEAMDAAGAKITRIRSMSGGRLEKLTARAREHGLAAVAEMVEAAARSDFLNGKNRMGWKATADWLLEADNFRKVLEGTYDGIYDNKGPADPDTDTTDTPHHGKATKNRGDRRDEAAERERSFRARIIDKLNRPDEPDPDLDGCY